MKNNCKHLAYVKGLDIYVCEKNGYCSCKDFENCKDYEENKDEKTTK
jgi:hypothetical protein